jgi:signal transduction histidine kinase
VYTAGVSLDKEYRILSRKGRLKEIRFIATAVAGSGRDREIQGILQDITEKKNMERQAIQNEKLASLGFLVSGIAHEINNPNNFISFNIQILREYLENILPVVDAHARKYPAFEICNMRFLDFRQDLLKLIDNIENGSLRINKIVSNLRKFVHMKSETEYQQVDVKKTIQGCLEIARGKVEKLAHRFEVCFGDPLPRVYADPEIIEIAVINLLINAAQACDKSDSFVRLAIFHEDTLIRQLVITVTDNGCGMDELTVSRVFDPFFSTKSSEEGAGIGLALCHNLVSAMGGRIEVQSKLGEGSVFTLLIPENKKKELNINHRLLGKIAPGNIT